MEISATGMFANVTDMSFMFAGGTIFNGDISQWNVSSVREMSYMFYGATTVYSMVISVAGMSLE
jgi:surface protein